MQKKTRDLSVHSFRVTWNAENFTSKRSELTIGIIKKTISTILSLYNPLNRPLLIITLLVGKSSQSSALNTELLVVLLVYSLFRCMTERPNCTASVELKAVDAVESLSLLKVRRSSVLGVSEGQSAMEPHWIGHQRRPELAENTTWHVCD